MKTSYTGTLCAFIVWKEKEKRKKKGKKTKKKEGNKRRNECVEK